MPLTSACVRRCLYGLVAPGEIFGALLAFSLEAFGEFDQPLGRGCLAAFLGLAVEQHILHPFQQIFGNIRVNAQLPGVDDAHGHACLHRVVKEGGMDRLPNRLIAAE